MLLSSLFLHRTHHTNRPHTRCYLWLCSRSRLSFLNSRCDRGLLHTHTQPTAATSHKSNSLWLYPSKLSVGLSRVHLLQSLACMFILGRHAHVHMDAAEARHLKPHKRETHTLLQHTSSCARIDTQATHTHTHTNPLSFLVHLACANLLTSRFLPFFHTACRVTDHPRELMPPAMFVCRHARSHFRHAPTN
jgi:hypothetical protein